MKSAGYIAVMGGTFLILGGATGSTLFGLIKEFIAPHLSGDVGETISLVLEILIFLAALGGIMVIAGGYFVIRGNERVGKILIFIGLGLGLIGLIIGLIVALGSGTIDIFTGSMLSFTGIGSIMAIVASKLA